MILDAAGNDVVRQAYAQTHCHLHVFRLFPVDFDGAITIAEHRTILEAISSCDRDAAELAMAEHIRKSFERSAEAFDEPPAEGLSRDVPRRIHIVR